MEARVSKTYVKHGYTMADLYDLARVSVLTNRTKLASYDYAGMIDDAFSAACTYLLEQEKPPMEISVMWAAFDGARSSLRQQQRDHGLAKDRKTGRQFARYWFVQADRSPEDQIVEPMALRQVWAVLSHTDRQALQVAAMFPDSPQRAAYLGISARAFEARLYRARCHFKHYWYEGETAPPTKGVRRIGGGFAVNPRYRKEIRWTSSLRICCSSCSVPPIVSP